MSQQQTLSCPITPPFAFTEQSTLPLLPSIQLTANTPELPSLDQTTTTTPAKPSHNQTTTNEPELLSLDQTTFPIPDLPSHDQTNATTPELPANEQTEAMLQDWIEEEKALTKKSGKLRLVIILAVVGLGCAIYFIWHLPSTNDSSSVPLLSPASYTNRGNSNSSTANTNSSGTIQVYVTGAVQHPGVYTLSNNARIYQLLDAAGGPLPNANLVALNLAEKLVDGQEVYVSQIGETPPVLGQTSSNSPNQGQLVNINTASLTDLEQQLHLSAKSAQEIISYRQQHGPFQSVAEVQQAVSQTIYNKIKNQITV